MPRSNHRLAEFRATVGPWRSLWIAPLWMLSKRYIVIVRDLHEPIENPEAPTGFQKTELMADQCHLVCTIDTRLSEAEVRRRLEAGQRCDLWWFDGQPVHFRWVTDSRTALPFLGLEWQPEAGDLLLYEVFTRPDARVKSTHSKLGGHRLMEARQSGYQRMISLCAWWSRGGLSVGRKTGFQPVGTVARYQLGAASWYGASGAARVTDSVLSVGT